MNTKTRSVRLVAKNMLRMTIDGVCDTYALREVVCEIGGRGFVVQKQGASESYAVRVGEPGDVSCECLGFLKHSRCKHVSSIASLIVSKKL